MIHCPPLSAQSCRSCSTKHDADWSPYQDNGGCVIAIGGPGYVIIAADTRLSEGFTIFSREDSSKVALVAPRTLLGSTGMQADRIALQHVLKEKLRWYNFDNNRSPNTESIAQLLSNELYFRRFFPLYTFNVLAGLNAAGDGICYSYDAIGCTEPLSYGATGSGHTLIEPLLDHYILRTNQSIAESDRKNIKLSKEEAQLLVKDAFSGASERDIYCGDTVIIKTLTPDQGLETEVFHLRQD
ncbi:20S proteasome beta 6 subunit [Perkinsela sp. CCAP 1560/4]|nr:20S proteasome beta 6 subunit [Perkinsela sp. CCAP 1560/4]KNH09109.1 20S proteasome beta 6 subunit [Perkinsela sp. CCAP 1560/4]|eukprot:KNH05340.1 20S proteasome beta 6 subunit [Perkinsela sp. CCAP 1560/4]